MRMPLSFARAASAAGVAEGADLTAADFFVAFDDDAVRVASAATTLVFGFFVVPLSFGVAAIFLVAGFFVVVFLVAADMDDGGKEQGASEAGALYPRFGEQKTRQ